jgi:hypothetical protein
MPVPGRRCSSAPCGGHGGRDRLHGKRRQRPVAAEVVHQPGEGLLIGTARRPGQARLGEERRGGYGEGLLGGCEGDDPPGHTCPPLWDVAGNASPRHPTRPARQQGHDRCPGSDMAGNGPFPATGCRPAPEAGGPCGDDQPAAPALQCLACDQKARPAEWEQRAADAASMVGGRVNPAGANRARPTMVSPIVTIWTTPFGNERVSSGWSRLRTCTVPTATPPRSQEQHV